MRKSISSLFLGRAVQEDFLLAAAISLPCPPPQPSLPSMCASSSVSAGLCGSRFAARLACNSAQEQRPELGDQDAVNGVQRCRQVFDRAPRLQLGGIYRQPPVSAGSFVPSFSQRERKGRRLNRVAVFRAGGLIAQLRARDCCLVLKGC